MAGYLSFEDLQKQRHATPKTQTPRLPAPQALKTVSAETVSEKSVTAQTVTAQTVTAKAVDPLPHKVVAPKSLPQRERAGQCFDSAELRRRERCFADRLQQILTDLERWTHDGREWQAQGPVQCQDFDIASDLAWLPRPDLSLLDELPKDRFLSRVYSSKGRWFRRQSMAIVALSVTLRDELLTRGQVSCTAQAADIEAALKRLPDFDGPRLILVHASSGLAEAVRQRSFSERDKLLFVEAGPATRWSLSSTEVLDAWPEALRRLESLEQQRSRAEALLLSHPDLATRGGFVDEDDLRREYDLSEPAIAAAVSSLKDSGSLDLCRDTLAQRRLIRHKRVP